MPLPKDNADIVPELDGLSLEGVAGRGETARSGNGTGE